MIHHILLKQSRTSLTVKNSTLYYTNPSSLPPSPPLPPPSLIAPKALGPLFSLRSVGLRLKREGVSWHLDVVGGMKLFLRSDELIDNKWNDMVENKT